MLVTLPTNDADTLIDILIHDIDIFDGRFICLNEKPLCFARWNDIAMS